MGPAARDRALRRFRVVAWSLGATAVGATGGLSAVAARAFKGHGRAHAAGAHALPRHHDRRVAVPPAQAVPPIDGQVAPLAPPPQPPATVPVPVDPQPPVSGGS
jgi:hypothetical protein